jgi:hypothetical protein
MSEPEDFLKRWSRRKREVAAEDAAESAGAKTDAPVDAADVSLETSASEQTAANGEAAAEAGEPAFDISKLPSVESITAETDIRPFLATGVPAHLTQAALRKLWVTDPQIRDFIEMAENQWDFNAPGIPGFDSSAPENVKELVAQIFSKTNEVLEKVADQEKTPGENFTPSDSAPETTDAETIPSLAETNADANAMSHDAEQSDKSAHSASAEQHAVFDDEQSIAPLPRRHGSALPI